MDKHNKGIKLKRLRARTTYSLEEVAAILEITSIELADIEKGKRYPSDASLRILLDLYKVTMNDLEREDFIDHEMRKKVINYVQIGISIMLVMFYGLPFAVQDFGNGTVTPLASGFMMLGDESYGYNNIILVVFLILVLQVVVHLLLYTNLKKYSNTFKTLFLMFNLSSAILMFIDFQGNNYSMSTLKIYTSLFVVHILITAYDMIRYPLGHDFIHEKGKMRRALLLLVNIVYFCFFMFVLRDTIMDTSYTLVTAEIIFLILWAGYLLAYLIMKKSLFEKRWIITIALVIPPVVFGIFYSLLVITSQIETFEPPMIFVILFLFLPVFVVNVDYFIDMIRGIITKGDTKEEL